MFFQKRRWDPGFGKIKEFHAKYCVRPGRTDSEYPHEFCHADGLFIAMGTAGSTEIARQMGAELTEKGNILVNENMETTIPGLYAAGDCTGGLLQVAKAVCDGEQAGINAGKYVRSLNK